jgi:branched-chain amino acid transport system substrate-binding protein
VEKNKELSKELYAVGTAGVESCPVKSAGTGSKSESSRGLVQLAKMREMPINDFFAKNGKLREDGRMLHDIILWK